MALPNGVTVAHSYDANSRVTGLAYSANGTQLGNLTYSYDADGRRTVSAGSLAAVKLPSNVAGGSGTAYNADNNGLNPVQEMEGASPPNRVPVIGEYWTR